MLKLPGGLVLGCFLVFFRSNGGNFYFEQLQYTLIATSDRSITDCMTLAAALLPLKTTESENDEHLPQLFFYA